MCHLREDVGASRMEGMRMKKFEYKMISVSMVDSFNRANEKNPGFKLTGVLDHFKIAGNEGWEFVCEYSRGNFLFKREFHVRDVPFPDPSAA